MYNLSSCYNIFYLLLLVVSSLNNVFRLKLWTHFFLDCYMPYPSHFPWFYQANKLSSWVQIMNLYLSNCKANTSLHFKMYIQRAWNILVNLCVRFISSQVICYKRHFSACIFLGLKDSATRGLQFNVERARLAERRGLNPGKRFQFAMELPPKTCWTVVRFL